MASIRIPNMLHTLNLQKSFDSSEHLDNQSSFDDSLEFPLENFSKDYVALNDPKFLATLPQDELLYLQLLRSSCTGRMEWLHENPGTRLAEIVNQLDQCQGAAPLHYAALNGYYGMVQHLLEHGAKVDMWNRNNKVTPLLCAAVAGHLNIVELLLRYKCNVNAGLNEHSSALLWAVRRNHPAVVQCLLDHDACQTSAVAYSETPIHAAVISGSTHILTLLTNSRGYSKADLCWGTERNTPLHLAASGEYPQSFEMCKLLLDQGDVNVNSVNSAGKTPLHMAVAAQDVKVVRILLGHWAVADMQDDEGRTPIFYTIGDEREALRCLKALCVEGKCDVNHQDIQGYTALHLAAYKEAMMAAELLLLEGADFSLKAPGGQSALSILRRKIPTTEQLLSKVFDQAVTVSAGPADKLSRPLTYPAFPTFSEHRQNCKIRVNFDYVVASSSSHKAPSAIKNPAFDSPTSPNPHRNSRVSAFAFLKAEHTAPLRKETAKIKCLLDENHTSLLLHPVVHSFLVLKWQKARPIFLTTFIIKALLVLLISAYVQLPFLLGTNTTTIKADTGKYVTLNSNLSNVTDPLVVEEKGFGHDIPKWYIAMYVIIVTMATLNCFTELLQILRSPKTQLQSVEPWIFVTMVAIMVVYMYPDTWGRSREWFHKAMAATGVCLVWIDIWMYMSRFPNFGLSIRIFFKVLQNFWLFIFPHMTLFAGFILAFTLLFPYHKEYGSVLNTITKAVRIMAGDSALPETAAQLLTMESTTTEVITHILVTYIYTAYVLTVGIVLMNMLIGLAVHDIQGIYAQASVNRLTKQTVLLNTLEANFNGKWFKSWIPQGFINKYINMFGTVTQSKILTFKPYDSRDTKLDADLKSALLDKGNNVANGTKSKAEVSITESAAVSSLVGIQSNVEAVNKFLSQYQTDQQKLMNKVEDLSVKLNLLMENVIKSCE